MCWELPEFVLKNSMKIMRSNQCTCVQRSPRSGIWNSKKNGWEAFEEAVTPLAYVLANPIRQERKRPYILRSRVEVKVISGTIP